MATIKAIEGRSVHQIQSGQVIVDLNSVVKELVENSLDADASSIEIRFKNHGLDSIEVQDNGKGIAPEDFETVALKHHTSKLSNYEDLTSLDTFGFRGEALSSLCALAQFYVVTTRAEDGAKGQRLDFEVSGKLKGTSVVAAQKGTTVSVETLFCNLPVRRKELEKNIKRDYSKVLGLLHAYACISMGVRFAVSNQMPKGKKVAVFSTKSNQSTKENITNVFGTKTLLALVKLDLKLEMEPSKGPTTQGARNWDAKNDPKQVRVVGHISRPFFGEGRQAPDRQMFFVNSRPCSLPQVSKAFNEVYKSFNVSQSPFIFANLIMDTNSYDVNVSPDKRTIMLHDQSALLESLKAALTELFEHQVHTVPQSQAATKKLPAYQTLKISRNVLQVEQISEQIEADGNEEAVGNEEDESEKSGGSVSLASASKDPQNCAPVSLIHNWVGRDSKRRSETPAGRKSDVPPPKDKQMLAEGLRKASLDLPHEHEVTPHAEEDVQNQGETNTDTIQLTEAGTETSVRTKCPGQENSSPDPYGTPYDDLFSQRPSRLPKPVQDFNAALGVRLTDATIKLAPTVSLVEEEESVTALTPNPQKPSVGPTQKAFDRMRPKRSPGQIAEITIGDTTTTTEIGPAYKKRRLYEPSHSQSTSKLGASPLLVGCLRNFAAPGTQLDEVDRSDANAAGLNRVERRQMQSEDEDSELDENEHQQDADGITTTTALSEEVPTSEAPDDLLAAPPDEYSWDDHYLDEDEKKIREEEKIARMIQVAEEAAAQPTEANFRRAIQALKTGSNRKDSTLHLIQYLDTSVAKIESHLAGLTSGLEACVTATQRPKWEQKSIIKDELNDVNAESRLALTVSKKDFARMRLIGQFNLGFILAVRPQSDGAEDEDELFIIDQHAADEKYNFERLQRIVTIQSQRLVHPLPLELSAVEKEIILTHSDTLKANGFEVETTSPVDNDEYAGRRCHLLSLPMSANKTFDLKDLEELLHVLSEHPAGSSHIPRPSKVRSMLAMRACRSSIMVGKTLTHPQMRKVVRHMGEMEKPWNCPHGRPTMRHLASLGAWQGWEEGFPVDDNALDTHADVLEGGQTDWKLYLEKAKARALLAGGLSLL